MRNLTLIVLAAASLLGMPTIASAQYMGPYYYDDGPPPHYYRHRYRERYYDDDDRYYHRRHYRDERYYREPSPRYRTWNGCPHGYTVQDGVCKPYTGR